MPIDIEELRRRVNADTSQLRARIAELEEAGRELLSGHDNLYRAHWVHLPTANPVDDLAAAPMRRALSRAETTEDFDRLDKGMPWNGG